MGANDPHCARGVHCRRREANGGHVLMCAGRMGTGAAGLYTTKASGRARPALGALGGADPRWAVEGAGSASGSSRGARASTSLGGADAREMRAGSESTTEEQTHRNWRATRRMTETES